MEQYPISLDTITYLCQNPDSVWMSPERDYAVVVLNGIVQVIVADFSEVRGSEAFNAYILDHLPV